MIMWDTIAGKELVVRSGNSGSLLLHVRVGELVRVYQRLWSILHGLLVQHGLDAWYPLLLRRVIAGVLKLSVLIVRCRGNWHCHLIVMVV
jgi:hypothetical protein